MKSKKNYLSLSINLLICVLVTFSITWNFILAENGGRYHSSGMDIFRYFTADSNVFLGLTCFLFMIYNLIKIKKPNISLKIPLLLKYMSVICVSITMLVVIVLLVPYEGFEAMYSGPSIFTHLINPLLGIGSFIFLDNVEKIPFKSIFLGIIPLGIYGMYYVLNIIINGPEGNDFYKFMRHGVPGLIFSFVIIVLIYFAFAVLFYKLNQIVKDKSEK